MTATERVSVGRHTVRLGNPGKLLFTDPDISKGELADYFRAVAPAMLPHLRDRPLALQRFPDGVAAGGFFQKRRAATAPEWVNSVELPRVERGDTIEMVCCPDEATLVYLADQAVVVLHALLSRVARPDHPVRLVFDLDPPGDGTGADVLFAARAVRGLLDELGLPGYPMTTGSRGLHVTVPLAGRDDFDTVRSFARDVADVLADRHPDRLTTEVRIARRGGRLFVDTLRNAYAQHAVAPYSPRPLPGAPVATPLDWAEVDDDTLTARRYRIGDVPDRLDTVGDPWRGMDRHARRIGPARRALDRLRRRAQS